MSDFECLPIGTAARLADLETENASLAGLLKDIPPFEAECEECFDKRLLLEAEAAAELRRLHDLNGELLEALRWIERRCPAQLLLKDLHSIHMEAAHDAGACARAAIAKAEGQA